MQIIKPSFHILSAIDRDALLKLIELAGRVCYKSEDKITPGSAPEFVSKICNVFKHESVIEHAAISVKFICDRGVTHELVRHRLCSFSQESTRYCNYSKDKFGREITVIEPLFFERGSPRYQAWQEGCLAAEKAYFALLDAGATPQEARSVLPNSLKTEIVVTANLREWRHVFSLRTAQNAHPQMREIMQPLAAEFARLLPEIFSSDRALPQKQ